MNSSDLQVKAETPGSRIKKIAWFVFKIVLAVGIMTWLIASNFHKFAEKLESFNFLWLIPTAICYFVHMLVGSWRWFTLTKVLGIDITLKDAFFLTMKAYFFSLVIPGGAIGGDIAKVGFLSAHTPKGQKIEGAFTILIDRITGMIALFSTAIVVTAIAFPMLLKMPGGVMKVAVYVVIFSSFCGLAAGFAIFFHRYLEKIRFIGFLMRKADEYTHGVVSRMTKATDMYSSAWRTLLVAVLVSIVFVHLNLVLAVYFVTKGLGVTGLPLITLTESVIVGNIAGLLPSLAGLGIRDSFIKTMLTSAGLSVGTATAIPIIYSAVMVVMNMSGGFFFIFSSGKKKHAETENAAPLPVGNES